MNERRKAGPAGILLQFAVFMGVIAFAAYFFLAKNVSFSLYTLPSTFQVRGGSGSGTVASQQAGSDGVKRAALSSSDRSGK